MKKKIISTIIAAILLIIMNVNYVLASRQLYGLAGVQTIAGMGKASVEEDTYIQLTIDDLANSANKWLYCIANHNRNSSVPTNYKVLTYVEIEDGYATSWQYNETAGGVTSTKSDYHIENKILAQILTGAYGDTGYGSSIGNYTPTQKGVYAYWATWVEAVGYSILIDDSWIQGQDGGGDESIVNLAITDVTQNGMNPSAKLYLLNNWDSRNAQTGAGEETWQRLMIADSNLNANSFVINKVDKNTREGLSGVEFSISGVTLQLINADKGMYSYVGPGGGATVKTVDGGAVSIVGLPRGTYTIKETNNPHGGYINTDFSTTIHYPTQKSITVENEREPGSVAGTKDGYIQLTGKVWEAYQTGKDNHYEVTDNYSSTIEEGSEGLEGIKVTWYTQAGVEIGSTTTGDGGKYTIRKDNIIQVRTDKGHWFDDTDTWNKVIKGSYVIFEYNGVKYTTVTTGAATATDTSKAEEIIATRNQVDGAFEEVTGRNIRQAGRTQYTFSNPNDQLAELWDKPMFGKGLENLNAAASTRNYLTDLSDKTYRKELDKEETYVGEHKACTKSSHNHSSDEIPHCECGEPQKKPKGFEIQNINLGLVPREQPDVSIVTDVKEVRVIMKGQEYTYVYGNRGIDALTDYTVSFKNNKGQYSRPINPADIAYVNYHSTHDLEVFVTYNIRVVNQSNTLYIKVPEIVNYYDSSYDTRNPDSNSGGYKDGNTSEEWYTSSKYSDTNGSYGGMKAIYYRGFDNLIAPMSFSDIASIEFKVNPDKVNGLIGGDLTLENISEINIFSTVYGPNTLCAEMQTASALQRTYMSSAGADKDSNPGNASSNRGEDDTDDAPSLVLNPNPNYKLVSGTVWEDRQTTDSQKNNERLGSGTQDKNNVDKQDEKGVANVKVELLRVKDDGTLEEGYLYYIGAGRAKRARAVTYTNENGDYTFGELSVRGIIEDNYIIKYTYGDGVEYYIDDGKGEGLTTNNGTTTVKSSINGNVISARNYKSTIVTDSLVKQVIQGTYSETDRTSDKWHLQMNEGTNTTIAVDDLNERLGISDLQYSNYNTPVNMSAYTRPFKVQIEYTVGQSRDVQTDGLTLKQGGKFANNYSVFDFGIIERPREDIVINKTIENLKITLANGQVLTEGNPYTENMNYVKALGENDIKTRSDSLKAKAKLLYIEMDSELIQGARLDIVYKITVTNNSEKDYEYAYIANGNENGTYSEINNKGYIVNSSAQQKQASYYYYGTNPTGLIQQSVEWVADYMDPELTCTVGEDATNDINKDKTINVIIDPNKTTEKWIKTTADKLNESGNISKATQETVNNGKYLVFVTNAFRNIPTGQSYSKQIFASKLLANQAEDYTYENHVEIIQLNGKIARTIDSVESKDRIQVTKQYKPGTYIPSLARVKATTETYGTTKAVNGTLEQAGLHNQDDDMITIRITPPTGLENSTIFYIIAAGAAFIVLVVGIIIIKKKVLNK